MNKCNECGTTWDAPVNYCPQCGLHLPSAQRTAIEIEHKLCTLLGRPWTVTGISVETLVNDVVKRWAVNPEMLAALRDYTQQDADGVWCGVSRQAVEEAIAILETLPIAVADRNIDHG